MLKVSLYLFLWLAIKMCKKQAITSCQCVDHLCGVTKNVLIFCAKMIVLQLTGLEVQNSPN